MRIRATALAVLLQTIVLSNVCSAQIELPGYVDPRFGKPRSTLYDLVTAKPEPEEMFWLKESLFTPSIVASEKKAEVLFESKTSGKVKPPKSLTALSDSLSDYVDANTSSVLTYLFKDYLKKGKNYTIPLIVDTDKNRDSVGYDEHYSFDSVCSGLGVLEADLKGKCVRENESSFGLIEINYSKDLELYKSKLQLKQLPDNGINESYSFKLLSSFPALLGFRSAHDNTGFLGILTSFDRLIYSEKLGRYIKPENRFSEFGEDCFYSSYDKCGLYFGGQNTQLLLGQTTETHDRIPFSKDLNLGIHFGFKNRPYLNLRNTILSDSTFINYGFYTQAELMMLKDLGYSINDREFYSNSLYKSGTRLKRKYVVLNQGFYAWSDADHDYNKDRPSRIPVSVASHVYGSYNDVVQKGTIASIGYSSVGIRIDGSYNTVTVDKNASIYENGIGSSGIAVTYGRDNIVNIDGTVQASSEDGVALRFDFGSNVLSDMREYQGSYRRVRTYDAQRHILTREKAQSVSAPEEIRGPLVSELNIRGSVSGRKNSIYIDESAHVKQINFMNRAKVNGNITSNWEAYTVDNGRTFYANHKNHALLPGILQFDTPFTPINAYEVRKKLSSLYTNVNFGVKTADSSLENKLLRYVPDKKSSVVIDGDISGKTLMLSAFGGHTNIRGSLDVKRLYIGDSVVNFKGAKKGYNTVEDLEISRGGQLDLSNGIPDTFVVIKNAVISGKGVICVDIDKQGNILDRVETENGFSAHDSTVNLEPGLSYNDIKSYQSDPKALLRLMNTFNRKANELLNPYGVSSKFPKHIWYIQGDMGRKVSCSSRGCHLGDFVNSYSKSAEELPLWRYILSFTGCILMLMLSVLILRKTGTGRFG